MVATVSAVLTVVLSLRPSGDGRAALAIFDCRFSIGIDFGLRTVFLATNHYPLATVLCDAGLKAADIAPHDRVTDSRPGTKSGPLASLLAPAHFGWSSNRAKLQLMYHEHAKQLEDASRLASGTSPKAIHPRRQKPACIPGARIPQRRRAHQAFPGPMEMGGRGR